MKRPVAYEANATWRMVARAILFAAGWPVISIRNSASPFHGIEGAILKVALVHLRYSWTVGVERYLRQIADYLVEEDHEVTVVCRVAKKTQACPSAMDLTE